MTILLCSCLTIIEMSFGRKKFEFRCNIFYCKNTWLNMNLRKKRVLFQWLSNRTIYYGSILDPSLYKKYDHHLNRHFPFISSSIYIMYHFIGRKLPFISIKHSFILSSKKENEKRRKVKFSRMFSLHILHKIFYQFKVKYFTFQ